MALGITQPIATKHYTEGSVGARQLGELFKLSDRGQVQSPTTGADIDVTNLLNELDKLKADLFKSIAGLIPSNGTDTAHDIDIAQGACADSTNALVMYLTSTLVKQIDVDWVEGSAAGGFPSGLTLSNATWYHVFLILKIDVDAGTPIYNVDAGFDTDISAANLLSDATGYTHFRRLGSVLTDGSANIIAFSALETTGGGLEVLWDAPPEDVNVAQGTSAVTRALSVPPDVQVLANIILYSASSSGSWDVYLSALAQSDEAATAGRAQLSGANTEENATQFLIRTNTSSQIRSRANVNTATLIIRTQGWHDSR